MTGAAQAPRGSAEPLDTVHDVALLDLDGTVYLGGAAISGAAEALRKAAAAGMRLAYVTNNASRTPAAIAALLTGFGVSATPQDVVTSAQAAARMLAERFPAGTPVLVVGGSGLRMALRERGLRPVSTAAEHPQAVVQGYWPGITYSLLEEGGLAVAAGALFLACNPDLTLPTRRGIQPGNGAFIQVIATATGVRPLVAGKPEPPLQKESVLRTGARHPLVVGDRLDTDIEGANRVGLDSLLVLTGVTRPADVILAPPAQRPTYLAEDLAGLLEPHPDVTGRGGKFTCNGWTARLEGGRLELTGGGKRIDGLRALCAAAWAGDAGDAGDTGDTGDAGDRVTPESARAAVQRLDVARLGTDPPNITTDGHVPCMLSAMPGHAARSRGDHSGGAAPTLRVSCPSCCR